MKKLLLTGVAFTALFAGSATAADMPARPVYRVPVVAPYNWSGFYVGGHFGGGWGRNGFNETACGGDHSSFPEFICGPNGNPDHLGNMTGLGGDAGSHQFSGALGGVQVGYNYQIATYVIGIEGQFSWSNLKGDHQNTTSFTNAFNCFECGDFLGDTFQATNSDRLYSNVKQIGTIAARLGMVSGPEDRTLFYVKGGVGYAKTSYTLAQQFSVLKTSFFDDGGIDARSINGTGTFTGDSTRWGPMAGIGIELGLFGNWTAKVEYDHLFLGSKDVALVGGQSSVFCSDECFGNSPAGTRTFSVNQDINILKFGLNYRFNNYYTPVVTK